MDPAVRVSGVTTHNTLSVDTTKAVGQTILDSMTGQTAAASDQTAAASPSKRKNRLEL